MRCGDIIEVQVTRVEAYGVFVKHGDTPGLILIPELSWQRIRHPSDVAQVGNTLRCKVLRVPEDSGTESPQFVGSVKQVHPEHNPWRDPEVFQPGVIFTGPVTNCTSYGYFVEHPRGVLALLHVVDVPAGVSFAEGETLQVVVSECDVEALKVRVRLHQEDAAS